MNKLVDQESTDYISRLGDKIDEIETLIIKLEKCEKPEDQEDILNDILGRVHSLKGSSGSYGFNALSQLCHKFEDLICATDSKDIETAGIDKFLLHIDKLKQITSGYSSGKADDSLKQISHELEANPSYRHKTLIVENLNVLKKQYIKMLKSMGVQCLFAENGKEALSRLLTEKFDSLITSNEIGELSGRSLISALKSIDSENREIVTILITSKTLSNEKFLNGPDHTFIKDGNLLGKIEKIIRGKLTEGDTQILNKVATKSISNIIYIDDDTDLHPLVKIGLKQFEGLKNLKICSSGSDALQIISLTKPDLILLDYMMPIMDGPQTFKALRTQGISAPIIFLTGKDDINSIAELKNLGALGMIKKPFDPNTLANQIKKIIG